jgi:hypothetical protein
MFLKFLSLALESLSKTIVHDLAKKASIIKMGENAYPILLNDVLGTFLFPNESL